MCSPAGAFPVPPSRILVIYHAGFTHTATVFHYLESFRKYSSHRVEYFNIDQVYRAVDFSDYDALFINYCVVSATVARIEQPEFLKPLVRGLAAFRGPKILVAQDEYDFTFTLRKVIQQIAPDVVLTCVPPEGVERIYPPGLFPGTRFERALTGYIDDSVVTPVRPLADRDIPLGYRGRELAYRLGDLAWHKAEIGRQFKTACARWGIRCDIEVDEESRFHAEAWLQWLRRCRVVLGSPSGANVFDFDGSLHRRVLDRLRKNPDLAYRDVRDEVMRHAVDFDMGQLSPRIFEAAASGTAMALLRGSYSGVLEPDEHYIPIEWDYSNIDSVIERILDVDAMQAMADRAHAHIVGNPANHYRGLVARIDGLVGGPRNGSAPVPLTVTDRPLGNDPYMVEKLTVLRAELRGMIEQTHGLLRDVLEQKIEFLPNGSAMRFDRPR